MHGCSRGPFSGQGGDFPSHPVGAGRPSGGSAFPRAHLPPKSRRRPARDGHTPPTRASHSHCVCFGLARSGPQLLASLLEQASPPLPAASSQGSPRLGPSQARLPPAAVPPGLGTGETGGAGGDRDTGRCLQGAQPPPEPTAAPRCAAGGLRTRHGPGSGQPRRGMQGLPLHGVDAPVRREIAGGAGNR